MCHDRVDDQVGGNLACCVDGALDAVVPVDTRLGDHLDHHRDQLRRQQTTRLRGDTALNDHQVRNGLAGLVDDVHVRCLQPFPAPARDLVLHLLHNPVVHQIWSGHHHDFSPREARPSRPPEARTPRRTWSSHARPQRSSPWPSTSAASFWRQPTNQVRDRTGVPGDSLAGVISPPGPAPPRPPAAAPAGSARPAPPRTAPSWRSPSARARRDAARPSSFSRDSGTPLAQPQLQQGSAPPAGPRPTAARARRPESAPTRGPPRTPPGASRSTSAPRPRGSARPARRPTQSAPRQYSSLCRQRPASEVAQLDTSYHSKPAAPSISSAIR